MVTLLVSLLASVSIAAVVVNLVIVALFLRRQRELEELALIDAKERREYLAQASSRMAVQTANLRKHEYGEMRDRERESQEYDPMSQGNRRMREVGL